MDRQEAGELAERVLHELRAGPYDALVSRFLDRSEWTRATAPSGRRYDVQTSAFWDDEAERHVRVMVAVSDRSRWGFVRPVTDDFIIAPDGTFVGEGRPDADVS